MFRAASFRSAAAPSCTRLLHKTSLQPTLPNFAAQFSAAVTGTAWPRPLPASASAAALLAKAPFLSWFAAANPCAGGSVVLVILFCVCSYRPCWTAQDPHFVAPADWSAMGLEVQDPSPDQLETLRELGWVAWKPVTEVFVAESIYNLCCPEPAC
eukprot:m.146308 g.146308  ORF g.146308 m.146308 type:complete len:155 (-) comp10090_c0_seq6:521-985(-)